MSRTGGICWKVCILLLALNLVCPLTLAMNVGHLTGEADGDVMFHPQVQACKIFDLILFCFGQNTQDKSILIRLAAESVAGHQS